MGVKIKKEYKRVKSGSSRSRWVSICGIGFNDYWDFTDHNRKCEECKQ